MVVYTLCACSKYKYSVCSRVLVCCCTPPALGSGKEVLISDKELEISSEGENHQEVHYKDMLMSVRGTSNTLEYISLTLQQHYCATNSPAISAENAAVSAQGAQAVEWRHHFGKSRGQREPLV